jgi:hypothetical protein
MIFCYCLGFTIIKYNVGFAEIPGFGNIPEPYLFWNNVQKKAIFPLMLMFSMGWSLEMVTHLEELCFWLFLLNATAIERNWFKSPYFKTWVVGSVVAIIYMPLITIFTRANPLKNEAYTILGGCLGSLATTIWFLPILWTFPRFLGNLRSEGVDTATIVRLTKFSELNNIRVVFRFLFTVPLAILAIDGIRPHVHINNKQFATDFLVMLAGIGCVVSSAITVVIFFPRSIEGEIAARDAARERKLSRKGNSTFGGVASQTSSKPFSDSNLLTPEPIKRDYSADPELEVGGYHGDNRDYEEAPPPLRPNRKREVVIDMGNQRLTVNNLSQHNIRIGNVNPMIHNYTSPIDIASYADVQRGRLTFAR